ncbi:hypothetical protein ACN38_g7153 [Penicillium nordicum]|uniref:Uncharacterized protein n=1 Tax=Penicillium nordicum TaxID=229535 RepID=A0A0M8P248_9EURO|nr:hypothetical protein ACN38_g7153 [Penicillium nordicum]
MQADFFTTNYLTICCSCSKGVCLRWGGWDGWGRRVAPEYQYQSIVYTKYQVQSYKVTKLPPVELGITVSIYWIWWVCMDTHSFGVPFFFNNIKYLKYST